MSEPTILVTGAAGLLGHAVRVLLEANGQRVLPIDRVAQTEEGRPIVACDLSDVHRLHALAVENRITGIVHCGAHSGPMVARENPYSMVQVNIVGTANVLEIVRIHGARFVFCSSTSAYGNTPEGLVPEDVPLVPTSVYGASKVAGEQLVSAYSRQYGVDGVSLRLSWVYGPRRTTDCIVRTMIEDALAGRPTRKPFGRDFHRQFIHVEDAARALVTALRTPRLPRQTYNVTGGTYLTLGQIGDIVRRVLPQADIALGEGPDPVDDRQHRFDVSAVQQDLRFTPEISLEQGVRAYAAWLQNRAAA
jgi:UDP-glucuronate 4-epimerase